MTSKHVAFCSSLTVAKEQGKHLFLNKKKIDFKNKFTLIMSNSSPKIYSKLEEILMIVYQV